MRLPARIYEVFPLGCLRCGAEMRIVAFLTDPVAACSILAHLGEPTGPQPLDLPGTGMGDCDPHVQPVPQHEPDQRIGW